MRGSNFDDAPQKIGNPFRSSSNLKGPIDSYAVRFLFFVFRSDLGFSANRGRFTPAKPRIGRALLGMSSPTLREVPNAKIRLSNVSD